jgi:hypothetical protein
MQYYNHSHVLMCVVQKKIKQKKKSDETLSNLQFNLQKSFLNKSISHDDVV